MQGCAAPIPAAHLSIRMASVRRSFSSQVSLSSAMIFSVSCRARPSRGGQAWGRVDKGLGARQRGHDPVCKAPRAQSPGLSWQRDV